MRTLVYKRTHSGDPDELGRFGIHGCMGSVRSWDFDAVIGLGGIGAEPSANGLAKKITWVGIGPRREVGKDPRGPLITFDHFKHYGSSGPDAFRLAPHLADRIYRDNVRAQVTGFSDKESREIRRILALARSARPSRARKKTDAAHRSSCSHCNSSKGCVRCR